jgi:hypothetical protein
MLHEEGMTIPSCLRSITSPRTAYMTTAGWITMIVCNLTVWGGTFWCFWKVLQTPEQEKAPPGFGP